MQDVIGRYGGEEFVVLLPDTGLDVGLAIAERIRSRIAEFNLSELPLYTVSIGVASLGMEHPDMVSLLDDADKAMYRAKRAGKNRVVAAVTKTCGAAGVTPCARLV